MFDAEMMSASRWVLEFSIIWRAHKVLRTLGSLFSVKSALNLFEVTYFSISGNTGYFHLSFLSKG